MLNQKVYIQNNFFCRSRTLDIYIISLFLKANGYELVEKPDNAGYILLTTCGTADSVTKKSIQQIENLKAYAGELIVIGCLPDTDRQQMDEVFNGRFVKNNEMFRLDEIFNASKPFSEFEHEQMEPNNNEYYIEICRGCIEHCSYCAIKMAVGNLRSMPVEKLTKHINSAVNTKSERIIIGAENIGIYGFDINTNLEELLDSINIPENSFMIRLNNLHPKYLFKYSDAIIKMIKNHTIGLLKIPIQSGDQRILNLMNRNYDIEKLCKLLNEIRNIDRTVIIMTDIIVGFPGETLESLKKTSGLIKNYLDIGRIFVFTPKANTNVFNLPDQLGHNEKQKMMQILLDDLQASDYIININDDFVHTFCRSQNKFNENNPYYEEVKKIFIQE